MVGSPISISHIHLKCSFNELKELFNKKFNEFKSKERNQGRLSI